MMKREAGEQVKVTPGSGFYLDPHHRLDLHFCFSQIECLSPLQVQQSQKQTREPDGT